MRHYRYVLILIVLFTLTFVTSEDIGEFQLGVDDVEIFVTCNNCTSVNFTRVMGPNNQTILQDLEATSDGTYYYYTILNPNFTKNGIHRYCYVAGNNDQSVTGCNTFEITYTGRKLTTESASVYFIAITVLVFLFILILLTVSKLPSGDTVTDDGQIIQISMLKHLRPVLYMISFAVLWAIVFVVYNMTLAYLPTTMVGSLFNAIQTIMFWTMIIALPIYMVFLFTRIFQDKEFNKMLKGGIPLQGRSF